MMSKLALLHLILSLMKSISISAPFVDYDSIKTLATSLINNPENIIQSFLDASHLPKLLTKIFKQLNNGIHPHWIKENTINHLLVSQPKLGTNMIIQNSSCYDFIVVGAGTAGSIVASRLSENPSTNVILLEAGGPENILTDIPIMFPFLSRSPLDWGFLTEPQNNCFINIENQRVPWLRGKVMGGSSSVNTMFYLRGFPKDYDNWANITRDSSWKYNNVLPYFLKSEHNYDPEYCSDTIYHNCNGLYPVTSHWKTYENPIFSTVIRAAVEFGINQVDLNRPQQSFNGCNGPQQSIINGNRISVSKAFLESVHQNRKNLDIIGSAFVTQIIFSNRKAIGVKYDRLGVTYSVYARKEVILSAGSIKSPHILLTSGVGPRSQLQSFNIPVIADLAGVGENLHDHVFTLGVGYSVPSIGVWPLSINSFISYALLREGPMAYINNVQVLISSSINTDPDWPDIQLDSLPFISSFDPTGILMRNVWGLKRDVSYQMYFPHYMQPSFLFMGGLQRPKSRGKLYLNSSNPYVYPLIQPKYLSHPDDIRVLIEATRWLYRFEHTETFKNWTAKVFHELTVGCESQYSLVRDKLYPKMLVPNDIYLECHARHMTAIFWHYVGTCKMGNVSDRMAVVDSKLRVLGGISGLRVIDSSIMPVVSTGNTNAPTMMIAEKGAQIIKDYYNI